MMPYQVSVTGLQKAVAAALHMPTNSQAAFGTFLKNRLKQSHTANIKNTIIPIIIQQYFWVRFMHVISSSN